MLPSIMSRRTNLGRLYTVTGDVIFKLSAEMINMVPLEMYNCKLYV